MSPLSTIEKGTIGLTSAVADLVKRGFQVSIPVSEHSAFDLIITKGNSHKTVQVKYRQLDIDGSINLHLRTVYTNTKKTIRKEMNKDLIDIVCIYCPEIDECIYLNPNNINKTITIRTKPSAKKHGQQNSKFNWINDFRQVPFK